MLFDVFISHASEDKDGFVRPLVKKLQENRIEVWYDEFSMKLGDSLRQSIDKGLSKSRFGIVVLSKNFFQKNWTNWELDGLVARQMNESTGNSLIIPIWHEITKSEILAYSAPLADKVAIASSEDLDAVVRKIVEVLNPKGSTLLIARDYLLLKGIEPPIITDDWWLDMLEYCGKEFIHLEYMAFRIPWISETPENRGIYIARHICQKLWQDAAEEQWLSQLTPPNEAFYFIENNPGLKDVCLRHPEELALFLPQLTIPGFGRYLEKPFHDFISKSGNSVHGEYFKLCRADLVEEDAALIADAYFAGAGGGIGPSTRRYDLIDCVIWLLSSKSAWLPKNIRDILIVGMKEWNVWCWNIGNSISGFENTNVTGQFYRDLCNVSKTNGTSMLSSQGMKDLEERFEFSIQLLRLSESREMLISNFHENGFIKEFINQRVQR